MKKFFLAAAICTLIGCGTIQSPPVVNVKPCNPPTELVTKYDDLPLITPDVERQPAVPNLPAVPKVSQAGGLQVWKSDIKAYNDLNLDHSKLIDWINAYCK